MWKLVSKYVFQLSERNLKRIICDLSCISKIYICLNV
jgi:hypothetical protein